MILQWLANSQLAQNDIPHFYFFVEPTPAHAYVFEEWSPEAEFRADVEFKQLVQKHDPKHDDAGPFPANLGVMARSNQTARKTTAHADGATDENIDDGVDEAGEEQSGHRGKRPKLDPGMAESSPAAPESLPGATLASHATGDRCDAVNVCTRPLLVHLDQKFERVGLDCQQRGREIAKELGKLATDGTQVAVVTPGPVHEATRMCCLTVTAAIGKHLWLPNGELAFDIAGGIGHELKAHTGHEWELHDWSLDLDDVPEGECRIRLVLSTTAVAYSVLQARRTAILPLDGAPLFRMLSEADQEVKIRDVPDTRVFQYGATTRVHHIRLRGPPGQIERVLVRLKPSAGRLQMLMGFDRGTSWSPLRLKASFAHWDRVLAAPPTLEGLMTMSRQMHPADLVLAIKAALKRDPSAANAKNEAGDLPAHVGYWHGLREEALTPVLEANEAAIEESKMIKFLKGEPRVIVGTIRCEFYGFGPVRHAPDRKVVQAIDEKLFDATPLPSLVAAMIPEGGRKGPRPLPWY